MAGALLFLITLSGSGAQTGPKAAMQSPTPPGASLDVRANPSKATVGDRINIEFDLTLPRGFSAELPALGGQLGDFTVLEVFPGPNVPGETARAAKKPPPSQPPGDLRHHRARVVVAAFKPGEQTFPSIRIAFVDPGGGRTIMESPALKIAIESVLDAKD